MRISSIPSVSFKTLTTQGHPSTLQIYLPLLGFFFATLYANFEATAQLSRACFTSGRLACVEMSGRTLRSRRELHLNSATAREVQAATRIWRAVSLYIKRQTNTMEWRVGQCGAYGHSRMVAQACRVRIFFKFVGRVILFFYP
jgi:hypothetical protein